MSNKDQTPITALLNISASLQYHTSDFPGGLVVRIPRSHRGGRGSIPRLGRFFCDKHQQD